MQWDINVQSGWHISSGAYFSNKKCIYISVSGHIIACIEFMRYISDIVVTLSHEVIGIYGISVVFEGHICC